MRTTPFLREQGTTLATDIMVMGCMGVTTNGKEEIGYEQQVAYII
jgi:hypothetical protein